MRIVHAVRSDGFSGVERYLTYVAPEQARRGHEVVVIGGDPAYMAESLDRAGVRHRPAVSTGAVARSLVAERGFRPHVVHSHMTAADTASLATRLVVPALRFSTLHFAKPRGRRPELQAAWRVAARAFAGQVAISRFVAEKARTKSTVIWNGVPDVVPVDVQGGASAGVERAPVVLAAQRFEVEKETSVLLRAWAVSGLGKRGWELHLAGRGQERPVLEQAAADLGVDGSVRFLGMVDDLVQRMAQASIFVASAPAEPFGLSVVEAMRAGLPVVACGGGAHAELLDDVAGTSSCLVPRGDSARMGFALGALADDPDRRSKIGAANRRRFESDFTIEGHVDRIDELYLAAFRRRGAGA